MELWKYFVFKEKKRVQAERDSCFLSVILWEKLFRWFRERERKKNCVLLLALTGNRRKCTHLPCVDCIHYSRVCAMFSFFPVRFMVLLCCHWDAPVIWFSFEVLMVLCVLDDYYTIFSGSKMQNAFLTISFFFICILMQSLSDFRRYISKYDPLPNGF